MPNPSTPALLLMIVRWRTPFSRSASTRFSGIPDSPNPPIMMDAPSWMSAIASRASRTTLFTTNLLWGPDARASRRIWRRVAPDRVFRCSAQFRERSRFLQQLRPPAATRRERAPAWIYRIRLRLAQRYANEECTGILPDRYRAAGARR